MDTNPAPGDHEGGGPAEDACAIRVCPVCGSREMQEIRAKLVCSKCRTIIETCCEGGRG